MQLYYATYLTKKKMEMIIQKSFQPDFVVGRLFSLIRHCIDHRGAGKKSSGTVTASFVMLQ